MAFTSGVATDYLDLLNRLKAFVTQEMLPASERWQVLRWNPGPPAELVLQGPGLAGSDTIRGGILSEAGSDYGNWKVRGFTGWNSAQTFDGQYQASAACYALLMQSAMPYWLVASGRRIVMVVKTGTYYEMLYLGLFLPYATPGQYPYPLLVGASYNNAYRWSNNDSYRHHLPKGIGNSGVYYLPGGEWKNVSYPWPGSWGQNARPCPDGSYPLLPLVLAGLGEMDGCYAVPGFGNAAENLVRVGGIDHLVVQDVFRTGYGDYWALRLA